ncbi:MAG: hypothetical protein CM15mP68_0320 [Pseudomonadota bacterium]|nr:MAG: hypothetical protein CM15mP68_0320 [Pseudomonadota bacterium]
MDPCRGVSVFFPQPQRSSRGLPDGAEVFATNDFCPIAGFTMGDQVITVQGIRVHKPYAQGLLDHRPSYLAKRYISRVLRVCSMPPRGTRSRLVAGIRHRQVVVRLMDEQPRGFRRF